jgi:hypothetical protein
MSAIDSDEGRDGEDEDEVIQEEEAAVRARQEAARAHTPTRAAPNPFPDMGDLAILARQEARRQEAMETGRINFDDGKPPEAE